MLNDFPPYIDGIYHATDEHRLFDVILSAYQANIDAEEAIDYISEILNPDYPFRDKILKDCKERLRIIIPFLKYINYDKHKD